MPTIEELENLYEQIDPYTSSLSSLLLSSSMEHVVMEKLSYNGTVVSLVCFDGMKVSCTSSLVLLSFQYPHCTSVSMFFLFQILILCSKPGSHMSYLENNEDFYYKPSLFNMFLIWTSSISHYTH